MVNGDLNLVPNRLKIYSYKTLFLIDKRKNYEKCISGKKMEDSTEKKRTMN